jgi:hypothetical protein
MSLVTAKKDIVTEKNFRVATRGDSGKAEKGAQPHEDKNFGKVLVFFNDRNHGYWVDPVLLNFPSNTDLGQYIARKEPFDWYANTPLLPSSNAFCHYDFGANLRLCRKARRISQTELGKRMKRFGVEPAQATVCYYEGKKLCPNGRFVDAAAKVLQVPPWVFFINLTDRAVYGRTRDFLGSLSSACVE